MSSKTRIAVAIVAVVVLGGALYLLLPKSGVESSALTPSPSSTPSSAPVTTTQPVAAPSTAVSSAPQSVFDTRTIADDFALPMKVTLPVGWQAFHDITGALGLVNTASSASPSSTWWGPDLLLVEDAQIHDPSDVVSSEPATADRSRFVPWPADFIDYITGLPEVTVVSGPEPITIGRHHRHADHRDDATDASARLAGWRLHVVGWWKVWRRPHRGAPVRRPGDGWPHVAHLAGHRSNVIRGTEHGAPADPRLHHLRVAKRPTWPGPRTGIGPGHPAEGRITHKPEARERNGIGPPHTL